MAEVKCFQHSKNWTKKNINYLRIQRFKRLIHWFHFDPVRDLSHLLIVKTFLLHSATEFLCERKSSIFWRRQKSCSIHHRQIRLRTPKERAVFSDCLERIWSPQSLSHQPNKILCHPSHPTDFFATQILGGHVTSRNQGLSSNDQGRQRRETLGTRLHIDNQREREVRDCGDDTRQQPRNPSLFLRQSSLSVNNKMSSFQAAVEFDSN